MKRYTMLAFTNRGGKHDAKMVPDEDGHWVMYGNTLELEQERDVKHESALLLAEQLVERNRHYDSARAEVERLQAAIRLRANEVWKAIECLERDPPDVDNAIGYLDPDGTETGGENDSSC